MLQEESCNSASFTVLPTVPVHFRLLKEKEKRHPPSYTTKEKKMPAKFVVLVILWAQSTMTGKSFYKNKIYSLQFTL